MKERLYIIDASALGAYKHFAARSGAAEHADGPEGVRFWLSDFLAHYDPAHVVAVGDCSRESNWRKARYVEYKAARDIKEKDAGLIDTMRMLPEIFRNEFSVPWFQCEEFEGDDLCASFAARHDGEVTIITNDKDAFQLVDDRVSVFSVAPNRAGVCVYYTPTEVKAKMDVEPRRVRELLAIEGDKTDGVPGVRGLGHVFAAKAIQQTKSRLELERLALAGKLEGLTERNQKLFKDGFEDYQLSYALVGLRFDAPIPADFDTRLPHIASSERGIES